MIKQVIDFNLHGVLWLPETEVKAVLQITHGMTEHIERYEQLAKVLTDHQIAVAGFDLRGHGHNPHSSCATFGENGWNESINDIHEFHQILHSQFIEVPHFILGFSLGSFLTREYLSKYPEDFSGAIIMGTGNQSAALLSVLMIVVKTQIKKAGFDETTALVRKLSFETYNQKFKPNQTNFDWLISDKNEREKYLQDTLCRKDISSGLFWQLLNSMKKTSTSKAYENWPKNLPVLLISGQRDPVGDAGKGVLQVQQNMKKAGLTQVDLQLYPNARHDLLHEEDTGNAQNTREFLFHWIISHKN